MNKMNKINILNYNPDIEQDKQNIDNLMLLLTQFKENISKQNYKPYKNFLEKINKFISMISTNFHKELEEYKIFNDFYNDEKEDDTMSIDSISEYEDEEQYEDEIKQIDNFKKIQEIKYNMKNNLFDLEIETN
jgi:hypothetical protein